MSKRWMYSGLLLTGLGAGVAGWRYVDAQSIGPPAPPASEDLPGPDGPPRPAYAAAADEPAVALPLTPALAISGAPPAPGSGGTISLVGPPEAGGTITYEAGAPAAIKISDQAGGFMYLTSAGGGFDEAQRLLSQADSELEGEVQRLVREYSTPDAAETARGTLKQAIVAALEKQFLLRQQYREREIQQIEERVKKLRAALDKRAAAKEKIIERRLNELLTEAEGLGWGEGPGRPSARYGGDYGATSKPYGRAAAGPAYRGEGRVETRTTQ